MAYVEKTTLKTTPEVADKEGPPGGSVHRLWY